MVVLILDNTLQPILNKDEVSSLFSHPLASFLSSEAPFPSEPESVEVAYHSYRDVRYINEDRKFRIHSFLTGREAGGIKPVFGLTSGILIDVATIGYDHPPEFELQPPNAPTMEERIASAILTQPIFRQAYVDEGMDPELSVGTVLQRIKEREKVQKTESRRPRSKSKERRQSKVRSRL